MYENIPNPLMKRALLTPERVAIQFEGRNYTFKELYDMAYEKAGVIQSLGIKRGSLVSILLRSHIDTVVIFLAIQLLGACSVILNNRLTAKELEWQINDSRSIVFITDKEFEEKCRKMEISSKLIFKEELNRMSFVNPVIVEEVSLADICSIMYTSGTTGNPKGVMQTYGNHWWSAMGSAINLGLREDDSWLCAVPLFHISGFSILMRSIFYGMKIILHETFNEKEAIQAIFHNKVTIMSVVTTMLQRMIEGVQDRTFPSTFRCMLLGGGPAPLSILEKCVEKGIPVFQTYGMTETASQIVTLSPEYSLSKLGSAGKPLFPAQIKIVDDDGVIRKPQETGEIFVKGPNVTRGYLHNEEVNKSSFSNGWLKTGDIGYVDEEGFLYVLDRRSDLIISGGENIYPAEIENVLLSHPQIFDAGVVGVSDDKWGQVPVAYVKADRNLSAEDIIQYCQERLAKYKLPSKIHFVEDLPRNGANKLLRRELKEGNYESKR